MNKIQTKTAGVAIRGVKNRLGSEIESAAVLIIFSLLTIIGAVVSGAFASVLEIEGSLF